MNDDIIEMARQADDLSAAKVDWDYEWVVCFAKLVAAKEREACANVCLSLNLYGPDSSKDIQFATLEDCATAIRNRSEE